MEPKQVIRGYELQERVGAGGFGEVYRAYQPSVGRHVAIKIILPQYATHPEFTQRFEAEARLIARLEHPHVVPLYDYWRDPVTGGAYLVMRWMQGGNLYESLQRGSWEPKDAAQLLDQIADALVAAHHRGVVHRDVKPENILLDQDGNAYLSDFGIAKDLLRATAMTARGAVPGSLLYIPPEALQGQAVTSQSDLYSLGLVMYEVLTGAHPFSDSTPETLLVQLLREPLPPLRTRRPDLPAGLEEVVQRATAKNPAQRYPDALAFAEAFREAVFGPTTPTAQATEAAAQPLEEDVQLPEFLLAEAKEETAERPLFVACERELAQLECFLELALSGHGRVAFATGEAGSGKTALVQEFARRAQTGHADLVVATGHCDAFTGVGDPYLPFREILGLLTGDVEAGWAAGAISQENARRLWSALPGVVRALVDTGPDLIDSFVPSRPLVARAVAVAPQGADWLERLRGVASRERAASGQVEGRHFVEQYTAVLHVIAAERPILIVLDDLQWVDAASVSLLFHLGRNLAGHRILLVGAYRPDEVAQGHPTRDVALAERHPLQKVLAEFKGTFGDIWVDLDEQAREAGWEFVDALLDTEPNRLSTEFRQALHAHTGGHPLFTVELLRDMQERGTLVRDDAGRWIEGGTLDWSVLPVRVEGVIEERIGRLEEELRETLTVASVEGEDFTAQVVARVQEADQRGLLRQLSRELDKKHRLVSERGSRRVGGRRLHSYRFRHSLFQQHLYSGLGETERELMHQDVGTALEVLYEGELEEIVPQLARHFTEAGEAEKAVHYLLLTGDRARGLYAHQEAIDHYQRALGLLREQRDFERAARTLMKLGLTYHNAFDFRQARLAYEEGFILWERVGQTQPAVPPLPASQALRVDWFQGVMTLDPTMAADDNSIEVINRLFSGLVKLGPEMEILPDLAQTWEILDEGRTYVFHLRDSVRWSDGAPVTAEDFEYAWRRALTPATGSPVASLLYDVKGARAFHHGQLSDPDQVGVRAGDLITLVVELERPTGYFLQLLCHSVTHPLPRHVIETHGGSWTEVGNIVTNGPFLLEAWQQDECLVLRRNPAYYLPFRGNIERLELCLIADPAARLRRYEAGELDVLFLWSLPPAEIDWARQRNAGEYVSAPYLHTLFVVFDVSRPPFDDLRVRHAFALAIDKEKLADMVMQGTEFPATGGFVPPGMPGHSPEIGLPYEPDQARQLLVQAGYLQGEDLSFPPLCLVAPRGAEFTAEYLQAQWWENLRIETTWETVEVSTFLARLDQMSPGLFLLGWAADYPDPDNFLRGSRRVGGWGGWQNDTYDTLVNRARHLMDQEGRMELYRQADRILVEEAAIMPLIYGRLHMLVKPWVRKFRVSPISLCFFEDVIIEPH